MINITMMATRFTAAKPIKENEFFFNDLILLSSLTFLNEACKSNIAQIDIKQDKNNGKDLVKSLNMTSIDPQTIEPIQSANAYIALKNV